MITDNVSTHGTEEVEQRLKDHPRPPAPQKPEKRSAIGQPQLRYSISAMSTLDVNLRSGPQLLEYAKIADRIAADGHHRVLDWGCGFGQVSALLLDRGVNVMSYEYDPRGPAGSRSLSRFPQVTAEFGQDPVRLPYPTGAFDAVLSCGVLEHVQDPSGSLQEIRRVLQPGGLFYVFKLPNRWSWTEAVARLAARRSAQVYFHGRLPDDRLYTLSGARRLLAGHGYEVIEARLANMLPLLVSVRWTPASGLVWEAGRALSNVPGLRLLATNIEVVARRL